MKNKKILRVLIICLAVILCPPVIYGGLYVSFQISVFLQINKNIEYQNTHLEYLPVYLLIEPKGEVSSVNNRKNFSLGYAKELDKIIRAVFGDKLLTPALVKDDFESLEEMRMADSWPEIREAAGKIIVLLHPCDVTDEYISIDNSISSQAMFPMLRYDDIDKSYASFILDNNPESAIENNKKTVGERNLMVRTRADDYPEFSEERYELANNCGSHIITTDYPPRSVRLTEHIYDFGGYMFKLLK